MAKIKKIEKNKSWESQSKGSWRCFVNIKVNLTARNMMKDKENNFLVKNGQWTEDNNPKYKWTL